MPAKGVYLAIAGGGAVLLWSGLRGKSWSNVIRNLVAGRNPAAASPTTNPIYGASSPLMGGPSPGAKGNPGGGPNVTSGIQPSGPGENAWIRAFLAVIGAPQNQANINSIAAWIQHETPWPPVASNNPLNTTQNAPGATDYNSTGVKNYPSAAIGLGALATTIEQGFYSDVLADLRSGRGLCGKSYNGLFVWSGSVPGQSYSQVC